MIKRLSIFLSAFFVISLSNQSFALPSKHLINGQDTGWSYPLDDNTNGQPIQNITFGFMSYNNSNYPYHYAQDITKGYKEGDPVYAVSEGKIIRIRRSGGYGGGNPCNSTYNTLIVEHNYFKKDGTISFLRTCKEYIRTSSRCNKPRNNRSNTCNERSENCRIK